MGNCQGTVPRKSKKEAGLDWVWSCLIHAYSPISPSQGKLMFGLVKMDGVAQTQLMFRN